MSEIDRIRRWRDQVAERYGPGGRSDDVPTELKLSNSAWWRDVDTLLREFDSVQPAIDQMWKDHQCRQPELEAIVRDLASLDPVGEDVGAGPECVLCQAFKPSHVNEPAGPPGLEDHDENCPWRRAVEWVSTQEEEGQ